MTCLPLLFYSLNTVCTGRRSFCSSIILYFLLNVGSFGGKNYHSDVFKSKDTRKDLLSEN